MIKKILSQFTFVILANVANAYDFEAGGLYYTIISTTDLTCEVVSGDKKYTGDVIIPETVTYKNRDLNVISIGSRAFEYCSSLTSVEIPASVTEIADCAFEDCSSLTSVGIPASVTEIADFAFSGCSSLTSVEIPASVTEIAWCVFQNCSSLTSVEIPASVTKIASSAFSGCSSITSVEIPASVTAIGSEAFSRCSSLTSVEIPASVTKIASSTFSGCSSLTSVEIPASVTEIGSEAFSGCSSLTSVEIPNSVRNIGYDAFTELHELIIEDGEKDLAYYISQYSPLTNLVKLSAARIIKAYNSYEVVFPNVLDLLIDNYELNNKTICRKIKKLTLGKNATVAKNLSLESITNLEIITLNNPTATIVCPKFTPKQYADLIIYVPEGSLTAYQNAEGWKNFWDIREVSTSGISGIITDSEVHEVARYNLQGQPVSDDYRGFVIIKYSDGTTCKQLAK